MAVNITKLTGRLMGPSHQVTPFVIVTIKLAALGIAIAVISLLIYNYGFNEWVAIGLGVVAYIVAKAILSIALGYVWGRQEAREIQEYLANQPPQVKQDIIDAAPADIKQRVAEAINKNQLPKRRLVEKGEWTALVVGALVLLYFGSSIKSKYDFQHFPTKIVQELPGSRLIGSNKAIDLGSPTSWFWPEHAWIFAMPDPVMGERFFVFRAEYGEKQATGLFLIDADCKDKKLTWYDPDEPESAFPARDLYGEPVTDGAGETYRRSVAQPDPPKGWMHEFCETDWKAERKAAAANPSDAR
jgi:hypothetical protein